jgi:uncharacterized protein
MSPSCHEPETQKATASCCEPEPAEDSCCEPEKNGIDWLFWSTFPAILILYIGYWLLQFDLLPNTFTSLSKLTNNVSALLHTIWWGILLGIVMLAFLAKIPRDFVMSALGTGSGAKSIVRATAAGVLLDLCSHGILMVGAKLYERGASIGQVMAFLIASPWNSFSLTLILFALIGLPLTLLFILLSMLIGFLTGVLFDYFVVRQVLPANPNQSALPDDFHFWPEAKKQWQAADKSLSGLVSTLISGVKESRMVLRWIFVGVLLASLIQTFVSTEHLAHYFGASLMGLFFTMIAATLIEVCSEGSTPVAADLVIRADAPGNGFAFLMAGVSTDYTEIMVVKDTTHSWKIALFLPLLTLPQIFVLAWIINLAG